MNIVYLIRDNGACAWYRVVQPIRKLAEHSGKHKVIGFSAGDPKTAQMDKYLAEANLIVLPRVCEENFIELIEVLKKEGKKVIIDHDDNMFDISPLSPHYESGGCNEVTIKLPDGRVMELWKHGKNINIEENRKRYEGYKRACEVANAITVTQPILAEIYKEYNKNVYSLPNCVDFKLWNRNYKLEKTTDEIRVGWYGGHSHYEDWVLLTNVLPVIMDKYKNVKLVIMGAKFDGTLSLIGDKNRVEFHRWVNVEAYPYKAILNNLDIAIIPLKDSVFNRCKSNIKWVEQAALGIPSVTSYLSPYKEFATEQNGVWIEGNGKEEWISGISYLIENEEKRREIGQYAYITARNNFDADNEWVQWENTYTEIMNLDKMENGDILEKS